MDRLVEASILGINPLCGGPKHREKRSRAVKLDRPVNSVHVYLDLQRTQWHKLNVGIGPGGLSSQCATSGADEAIDIK